jgi:hypothetical protein
MKPRNFVAKNAALFNSNSVQRSKKSKLKDRNQKHKLKNFGE